MKAVGFDNNMYLKMQSEQIRRRIAQFGGKLYLEFGGKLFDDYHASRVLPGFKPDSKIRMLQQLKDDVEIVITINAADIDAAAPVEEPAAPTPEEEARALEEAQQEAIAAGFRHKDTGSLSYSGGNDNASEPAPAKAAPRVGRNDPCPCGSGKKYKKCCGAKK